MLLHPPCCLLALDVLVSWARRMEERERDLDMNDSPPNGPVDRLELRERSSSKSSPTYNTSTVSQGLSLPPGDAMENLLIRRSMHYCLSPRSFILHPSSSSCSNAEGKKKHIYIIRDPESSAMAIMTPLTFMPKTHTYHNPPSISAAAAADRFPFFVANHHHRIIYPPLRRSVSL